MEHALKLLRDKQGQKVYIVFADLDHLKEINDTFGHAAGDFAIVTAADYLRKCMPRNAIIARIGGDEYVAFVIRDCDGNELYDSDTITHYLEAYMAEFAHTWYVLIFYILNFVMVGADLVLYYRNYRLDKAAESK